MEREASFEELFLFSLFHRIRSDMEGSERGRSEFRRANIVYFLSRNGAVEHPHLIRVHHLYNNGVHLHDVKRWLAELRGKDMPDTFAWSYKRRYKSGYVWQDLKNDDLITPISDNEYVLKGSYLQFHSLEGLPCDEIDKRAKTSKEALDNNKVAPDNKAKEEQPPEPDPKPDPEIIHVEQEDDISPKPPPQLNEDSPVKSNKQPDSSKQRRMAVFKLDASTTIPDKQEKKDPQTYKRSYSSKASHMFHNILTCGAADANESALLTIKRISSDDGQRRRRSTSDLPRQHHKWSETESSRKTRTSRGEEKAGSASYRPVGAPNCSQCGRPFEPERLQSHMQSCKALRRRGKERITIEKTPLIRRRESHGQDDFRNSISGYLT